MTGFIPVTFQPICSESPVPVFSFSARTILSAQLLCLQNEKLPLSAEHALEMVSFC